MTLKIGILGGTFNPVHNGHLLMAEGVLEKFKLNSVLFMPCNIPPHKTTESLVCAEHRLAMLKLAVKDNPSFKISMVDLKRGGVSYSVEMLMELHNLYKNQAEFFFIIGSDSVNDLPSWKHIDKIYKLCKIIVVKRPGFSFKSINNRLKIVDIPTISISSTEIRQLMRLNRPIRYLVPQVVTNYMHKNILYCG